MKFVVVTGMSGGGKSTAMKMLEDAGFYCVDNLPVSLISTFTELIAPSGSEIEKAALGLDVRSKGSFVQMNQALDELKEKGYSFELLFMDAEDHVLVKRYKETRRIHPVDGKGSIEESIKKEREMLRGVHDRADYVIDTSRLLTRELKEELDRIFLKNEEYNSLMINVMSFGFKHGIPLDADLVFDVRFLPNPFYIDELKLKTGNDREVRDYVMSFPEAEEFLQKLTDMIEFLIPNYVKEGKHRLVVAVGCTGGRHRSVTLANALYETLKNKGNYGLSINHRDAV
ncbi:MAG: RNase adapter RapZ [Roseburia sp.]|nr:RNase adapter RapZ [Roseburia sp.]MCM1279918.1 RNase adapter RapZ [Robinsoniella sp.]